MQGKGDARPESYWYDVALQWNELQKQGIGKKALERTLRKLGQQKIQSGKYAMLVDNLNVGRLLSPLISAMYGSRLQQKNSFLLDKLETKIASEKLTLIDDPHIPHAIGARWFDYEGVATVKRPIIEKGVLKTYFIDTYISKKMNIAPTVSEPSILSFELGNKSFDQLLASLQKGIWITGFNGGNGNTSTGDFSFGVEGFLIQNGKIVKPISEMNITGNLLTLWNNVIEIGNDPRLNSSQRTPSILFDKVDFSGL
jgi:PmbA protein